MPIEREIIVSAIRDAPNLTVAAKRLGSSRRTLQNRMRYYAMPPGKAGRPREPLPYGSSTTGGVLALAGLVVGGILVGRWWMNRKTEIVGGGETRAKTNDLRGLDAII